MLVMKNRKPQSIEVETNNVGVDAYSKPTTSNSRPIHRLQRRSLESIEVETNNVEVEVYSQPTT